MQADSPVPNMIDLIPCVLTAFTILFFVCKRSVGLDILFMLFWQVKSGTRDNGK